jgi:hypothetical protein
LRRNIFALLALAVLAVLTVVSQADALQAQKAYKEMTITITVTPSPAPVGFTRPAAPPPASAAAVAQVAQLLADPLAGPARIAFAGPAWDVAPGSGLQIAQSSAQPTPVPVQFVAKADPNAAFLHLVPHTPAISAGYGKTVFPCAFEIFTFYTNTYNLTDWGYGTLKTGAIAFFPIENYPTVSYLSWAVPDFGPTVKPYNNGGPPGETTWTGAKNQSQQHCIDLTLNVPNAQPPGLYTATIQYNLYVTLP